MGFLEDIGKKVADAGQKTVQKTKDMSDVIRLEASVTKEENKLGQIYSQIGKLYVELHADSFEDAFTGMFGEIREAEQNIQNYRQQIDEIKNSRNREEDEAAASGKCPNCGAAVPDGSLFCTSCGKPIPKLETSLDTAEKRFCAACGAELASDAIFCEKCGTKVL